MAPTDTVTLKNVSTAQLETISATIGSQLSPLGLEHYPFKIQWYNELVADKYRLGMDSQAIGFVIISTPDMFENAFIPYIRKQWSDSDSTSDPIDDCMKYYLNGIKKTFAELSVEVIHDFDVVHPHRRPRVLVQTAAHVSGAAYYYKPEVKRDVNGRAVKQLGVCIHPKFGGWFGIRGVVVFKDLMCDAMTQRVAKDVIQSDEKRLNLLTLFRNWSDWKYRDVIPVTKRYSELQKRYFALKPSERKPFIKQMINLPQN